MIVHRRAFWLAGALTLAAYSLSFVAHSWSWLGEGMSVTLVVVFAFLLWKKPAIAFTVLLCEFAATSFGRLLPVPWPSIISLRAALLLLALAASMWALREQTVRQAVWVYRLPFIAILIALAIGTVNGLMKGQSIGALVADGNGYIALLLLPGLLAAFSAQEQRTRLISALLGTALALSALTIAIFGFFLLPTIGPEWRDFVYRWIRDVRFGEITPRFGEPGVRRVFIQSQIFAPLLLLWLMVQQMWNKMPKYLVWFVSPLLFASLIIGGSRTFFLASLVATAVVLARLLVFSEKKQTKQFVLTLALVACLGLAIPGVISLGRFFGHTTDRIAVVGEAAVESRWNLLRVMGSSIRRSPLLGYGFGAPLTYVTEDPRLRAEFPDGMMTTTAFEWGWLEMWFKMGILGPIGFAWLICAMLWRSWKTEVSAESRWVVGTVVFLAVAHAFSPWLNHPIGVGLLLLAITFLQKENSSHVRAVPSGPGKGVV